MPLNLRNLTLPAGWDAAELTRLTLADGTTYEDMIADIDDALAFANDGLLNSYLGRMVYVTDQPTLEYDSGDVEGFERMTERAKGDGRKADGSGHMLPLLPFDYQLNWTYLWLRSARRPDIDRQINRLIENTQNIFEQQGYTRLFKMEEETGHYHGLGATGVSVPFCDGGNGSVAYTPVAYPDRGGKFQATHNHYLRLDGFTQANIETAVEHLWEHGVDGPYEMIIAQADVSNWSNTTNVTGFVERPDPDVMYGSDASLANIDDMYIGGIKTKRGFCRVKASGRIPTNYWGITKAYGSNDMMNPLVIRTENGELGASLVMQSMGNYPLQGATPMIFFGAGVGTRRELAVLVENDSVGSYASPSIS